MIFINTANKYYGANKCNWFHVHDINEHIPIRPYEYSE